MKYTQPNASPTESVSEDIDIIRTLKEVRENCLNWYEMHNDSDAEYRRRLASGERRNMLQEHDRLMRALEAWRLRHLPDALGGPERPDHAMRYVGAMCNALVGARHPELRFCPLEELWEAVTNDIHTTSDESGVYHGEERDLILALTARMCLLKREFRGKELQGSPLTPKLHYGSCPMPYSGALLAQGLGLDEEQVERAVHESQAEQAEQKRANRKDKLRNRRLSGQPKLDEAKQEWIFAD